MIKQIPNIITSMNLLCGCIAVFFAVSGDLVSAAIFSFLGIFFDFFDGLAARLLNAHSEVGKEFDSLADMITSGVVPAIVMVQLLSKSISDEIFYIGSNPLQGWHSEIGNYLPLIGLLIALASGYRLAKFNIDTRQTDSFIGLPTPANTLLILSLPLILTFQHSELISEIFLNQWFLIGLTILSSILLNAELPLFALKFKTWDFSSNKIRYVFLLLSFVAIVLLKFVAIPVIIALYIILSLFQKKEI